MREGKEKERNDLCFYHENNKVTLSTYSKGRSGLTLHTNKMDDTECFCHSLELSWHLTLISFDDFLKLQLS